ncbi:MFS transporter [Mesorhizobium sangaii]|uniref:Putative MFS family arabinose efflux permease n=1 Tax=Mesorhizobium sangaii TaxID=505389 RepID=A0A841PPI3_9HYPH|nr:MFS transporter [Mesorhizobium sangaii]MBB6412550.1 putative MFS family arabinose efflux permease [Mesorhizobium sangaii]
MCSTLPTHAVEANMIAPGPRTWQLYLALGFFQFVISLQGNIFPFLRVELDISYRTIGLHPTAFACGIILVGLLGPRVISQFGRRRMLMVGVFGFATAAVLLCLAPAAPVSIASFALLGMSGAFIPVIVFSTLADVRPEKRAVAFNEATAIASIFGIIAPILTGLCIYAGLGWRSAVLAAVAYGLAVLASLTRVGVPAFDTAASAPSGMLPLAYWAYWTAVAFGIATEFCVLLWAPTFLESVVGLSAAAAATAAVAFAVAMAVGRLAGSRILRIVAVPTLFVAAVTVALLGFLFYWGTSDAAVSIAGLFVLGFGISLFYPLVSGQAIGATLVAQHDRASARTALAGGVAILTMPGLLGELAGRVGLHNAHLLVPTLIVAMLAAFLVGRELERRHPFAHLDQ